MTRGFIGIFINEPSVTKSLARGITKERDSSWSYGIMTRDTFSKGKKFFMEYRISIALDYLRLRWEKSDGNV